MTDAEKEAKMAAAKEKQWQRYNEAVEVFFKNEKRARAYADGKRV